MGKKAGAASKASEVPAAKAKASAPGERPPRPSHGHKWDEEKQQWVGKGSLDERKAAKLKEAEAKEKPDGTVVKSWQRMPTDLLAEWAQREKRPKPYYVNARAWDRDKWRQKVIITDPKNKDASLEFAPYDDSESQFVAREHAALLALLKVQGTMPLERKLPEPYCDVWKASLAQTAAEAKSIAKAKPTAKPKPKASSAKAEPSATEDAHNDEDTAAAIAPIRASSNFASKAERDEAQRKRAEERNTHKARQELVNRANAPAPILLSRHMRAHLHEALGLHDAYLAAEDQPETEMTDTEAEAVTRCIEWGFAATEVMRALSATRSAAGVASSSSALAEALKQWLCLHMPEDELPEEFAAGRGQFTVQGSKPSPQPKGKAQRAERAAEPAPFEAARQSLLSWLREELCARLSSSDDAEALHASLEAILLGVDPSSADDAEAQEACENASIILGTEGEALDPVVAELPARWEAAWNVRTASKPDAAKAEPGADADAETTVLDDGSSSSESEAQGTATSEATWDMEFEQPAEVPGKKRLNQRGGAHAEGTRWFGIDIGAARTQTNASWSSSPAGQRMKSQRDQLPAAKSREDVLSLSRSHPVVLIQGETGCGKTTQVGQYLIEGDAHARVVVTQPRRVAVTSVAQRVADERGERVGEGAVGYSVRGETRVSRGSCRLMFCTNGVLLRRLLTRPQSMFSEQTCTHLVIDEVHERSVEIDLLLTLLHYVLPSRPKLRVLLMSATMDVKQLSGLFPAQPPILKIPGRTFPVNQVFLDDVDDLGVYTRGGGSKAFPKSGDAGPASFHLPEIDCGAVAEIAVAILRGKLPDAPKDGALLIFVPGVGEIDRISRELRHRAESGEAFVLPLHGGLSPDQQRKCFQVPASGGPRKVVVATNVAETSVTVPDVTIVIDSARERRLELSPGAIAPCLAERICARSSLTQRRGRAGRVRAGLCLTLLDRREYEAQPMEAPPEIEAASLDSLSLQVRVAGFDPREFLSCMPTPPASQRVEEAERMLLKVGATRRPEVEGGSDRVEVAALGKHLAALPCDVHTGKLLVVGALLGVASMAADVGAMLSVRSPLKSTAKDAKAEAHRERLRQSLRPGGTKSDHCLYAKLMQLWMAGNSTARRELCQSAALVWERMAEAASVRSQLMGGLRGLGFDAGAGGGDDRHAGEWRALRAALTAAYYPQVARVRRPPPEFSEGLSGAVAKQAEARKLRYFVDTEQLLGTGESDEVERHLEQQRKKDMRGFLHPGSVLFKESSYSCPYVVYSSKSLQQTKGDYPVRLNLSECSEASLYALLLFGGKLCGDTRNNNVTIDNWITFSGGSTTVVALVERLRGEIDKLLLRKAEEPGLRVGELPVCKAVATLLSTDGLG